MNTTETLQQLHQLKLTGMAAGYKSQLELPVHQQLETHELMAHLVQSELLSRNNQRTSYYLRLARLRLPATPEQIECTASRNLTKQQLAVLLEGHYIQQGEPILNRFYRFRKKLFSLYPRLSCLHTRA